MRQLFGGEPKENYTKLDVLEHHRKVAELEENSYVMIDDELSYLKPIQEAGYPTLKVEHEKGKAIPVKDFFKQAQVFISLMSPIADLETEIKKQISRYCKNGQSCLGIGNNRKADRIERALARAKQSGKAYTSLDAFLDAKLGGQESLRDALSYHRIGFFGRTNSQIVIEAKVVEYNGRVAFR